MQTKLTAAALLAALVIAGPALAEEPSAKTKTSFDATANGGFDAKETSTSTDTAGTTTDHEVKKSVDVDSNGDKTTTVKIKHTTDPKGLFNKHTTTVKNKAVEKNGKTEYSHKKEVNGKTVESTDDKTEQ